MEARTFPFFDVGLAIVLAAWLGWVAYSALNAGSVTAAVPKLLYSTVLLVGAFFLVKDATKVWDKQVPAIGGFKLTFDGKPDDVRAEALRARIAQRHAEINAIFRRENDMRNSEVEREEKTEGFDAAPVPYSKDSLWFASDGLSEIELKVQGVNFGQILGAFRRYVVPPNEITGNVVYSSGDQSLSAVVRWPAAPRARLPGSDDSRLMTFEAHGGKDADLATQIACSIAWAKLVSEKDSPLSTTNRVHYCLWAGAFLAWLDIRDRQGELRPEDLTRLEQARETVERLVKLKVPFAEVVRLRDNLAALSPGASTAGDGVIAFGRNAHDIVDTRRFKDIMAQISGMENGMENGVAERVSGWLDGEGPEPAPDPDAASPASAPLEAVLQRSERPVLRVVGGAIKDDRGVSGDAGHETLLSPRMTRVAHSTGYLSTGLHDLGFVGTGFVVAEDIVATATFIADILIGTDDGPLPSSAAVFTLADAILAGNRATFPVAKVIYHDEASGIALLRVPGLAEANVTPVELGGGKPAPGTGIAVLGFPAIGPQNDAALMRRLGVRGMKYFMPGLVLPEQSVLPGSRFLPGNLFWHDSATTAGTGGAPVIDLASGGVIGIHLGGGPDADVPKRNFAAALPPDFRAALATVPK